MTRSIGDFPSSEGSFSIPDIQTQIKNSVPPPGNLELPISQENAQKVYLEKASTLPPHSPFANAFSWKETLQVSLESLYTPEWPLLLRFIPYLIAALMTLRAVINLQKTEPLSKDSLVMRLEGIPRLILTDAPEYKGSLYECFLRKTISDLTQMIQHDSTINSKIDLGHFVDELQWSFEHEEVFALEQGLLEIDKLIQNNKENPSQEFIEKLRGSLAKLLPAHLRKRLSPLIERKFQNLWKYTPAHPFVDTSTEGPQGILLHKLQRFQEDYQKMREELLQAAEAKFKEPPENLQKIQLIFSHVRSYLSLTSSLSSEEKTTFSDEIKKLLAKGLSSIVGEMFLLELDELFFDIRDLSKAQSHLASLSTKVVPFLDDEVEKKEKEVELSRKKVASYERIIRECQWIAQDESINNAHQFVDAVERDTRQLHIRFSYLKDNLRDPFWEKDLLKCLRGKKENPPKQDFNEARLQYLENLSSVLEARQRALEDELSNYTNDLQKISSQIKNIQETLPLLAQVFVMKSTFPSPLLEESPIYLDKTITLAFIKNTLEDLKKQDNISEELKRLISLLQIHLEKAIQTYPTARIRWEELKDMISGKLTSFKRLSRADAPRQSLGVIKKGILNAEDPLNLEKKWKDFKEQISALPFYPGQKRTSEVLVEKFEHYFDFFKKGVNEKENLLQQLDCLYQLLEETFSSSPIDRQQSSVARTLEKKLLNISFLLDYSSQEIIIETCVKEIFSSLLE